MLLVRKRGRQVNNECRQLVRRKDKQLMLLYKLPKLLYKLPKLLYKLPKLPKLLYKLPKLPSKLLRTVHADCGISFC
jgi:hypothetical protein